MAVENRIARIKKRSGAQVGFDQGEITDAIYQAAVSIGGFKQDIMAESIYGAFKDKSDREIAQLLSDDVVMCLNANKMNTNRDTPPDIEVVQDQVVHVLRSRGFIDIADVYEVYRSGRTLIREKLITREQFAGNGFPQSKAEAVAEWNTRHNCDTIEKLNAWVLSGRFKDLVEQSIEEYERQLDEVVADFLRRDTIRVMLITGPSSSGKTTTTRKIAKKLEVHGKIFRELNLDDYFLGLNEYPQDSFGDWDFETPHALKLDLIDRHIAELLEGKTIKKPVYDFKRGLSIPESEAITIAPNEILLLDSLHGLYPAMTISTPERCKYKMFIEAMTLHTLGGGKDGIRTKWTDTRMLRRMLRDRDHRNHSPAMTLGHWHFVRKGELRDMIPFIMTTDKIINGGLAFELPVLKKCMGGDYPDPQEFLRQGRLDAYIRGERVKRLLDSLLEPEDISTAVIPADSHLREFIGGLRVD
ncbi:hypothetical protein JW905_06075 [bacterium]|nr:hypothetical protein [candidate division CSSED10-310 bacterium]